MDFFIENWYILVAIFAVGSLGGIAIYRYMKLPSGEQLRKVKEWLLFAVTEAEKQLGGGTGQLKLRSVYDLFVQRFPWLVQVITFDLFSNLVDEALTEMRIMLDKNNAVKTLVEGQGGE